MSKTQSKKQPNILIILTDEQRATMHFPKGWSRENLPALSLLQDHGLEFAQAFCNTCMCSPSRSTLFTSLYLAQHGVTDTLSFGGKMSVAEPTLQTSTLTMGKLLHSDYDVHYRGKWHMSKGGLNVNAENTLMRADIAQYGFAGWIAPDSGEDIALPNFGGGYAAHDAQYIDEAIAFVKQYKKDLAEGTPRRPFALIVSLVNPHDCLSFPNTYLNGGYVNPAWLEGEIELPITVDEDLYTNWKPAAQWQNLIGLAAQLGPLTTNQLKLQYVNFFANLMRYVDQQTGFLLEEFYERGADKKFGAPKQLAKDTLIVRTSDHGEMGLSHGGLRQKMFNAYEETMRVPFIFSNPEFINTTGKPMVTNQLAGLIDIMPTLAGFAGIDTSTSGLKGKDLSPVLLDPHHTAPVQESILFTFDDVKTGSTTLAQSVAAADRLRCVRTHDWKYVHYFDAVGAYLEEYELYYIKGVVTHETHPGDDPNDALGMALKGQPYEYVNLYYDENPLVKAMPAAAKKQIAEGLEMMQALLQVRLKDLKQQVSLNVRKKSAPLEAASKLVK